jgi:hypothetical protein
MPNGEKKRGWREESEAGAGSLVQLLSYEEEASRLGFRQEERSFSTYLWVLVLSNGSYCFKIRACHFCSSNLYLVHNNISREPKVYRCTSILSLQKSHHLLSLL